MGVEKNRQLSKSAKRDASLSVSPKKSKDQLSDMKAKLVASITELHWEIQRIELSSLFRKWKVGNFLLALKSLVGHGNFEREFQPLFGESLSFRQAQRYMQVSRTIAHAMPTLRARLIELRSDLAQSELSDEAVLKELKHAELLLLLEQKKTATGGSLILSSAMTVNPNFAQCLQLIVPQFDCAFLSEATDLVPVQVHKIQVGTNPVEAITDWPQTVLAIADASKESVNWIGKVTEAFASGHIAEALCVVPAQLLNQLPELLLHPEVLLNPTDIYLNPKKGKVTRYLVIYIAPSERHRSFLNAFSSLGTVKLPVHSNHTKG